MPGVGYLAPMHVPQPGMGMLPPHAAVAAAAAAAQQQAHVMALAAAQQQQQQQQMQLAQLMQQAQAHAHAHAHAQAAHGQFTVDGVTMVQGPNGEYIPVAGAQAGGGFGMLPGFGAGLSVPGIGGAVPPLPLQMLLMQQQIQQLTAGVPGGLPMAPMGMAQLQEAIVAAAALQQAEGSVDAEDDYEASAGREGTDRSADFSPSNSPRFSDNEGGT
jgi:hypothetical protein